MKILLTVLALFTMSFCSVSFAGVGAYNGDTLVGVFANVKCVDGVKCEKASDKLKISNYHKPIASFTSGDTTPSIANGTLFSTASASATITMFDDGVAGKEIIVKTTSGATTYDVTSTNLKCGSTDLVTAANDIVRWLFDGTNWFCLSFIDQSDNLN